MTSLSKWFVVFTNGSVIPTVIHFVRHQKYIFALQIGATAMFSFFHHAIGTGILALDESVGDLSTVLDTVYSYLSIIMFTLYLFLTPKIQEWMLQLQLAHIGILAATLYGNLDMGLFLGVVVSWILGVIFCHMTLIRPVCLYNPYLWLTGVMLISDLSFFFAAVSSTEFDWFHSAHHLFAFTLPLSVDCAVEWGDMVDWGNEGVW